MASASFHACVDARSDADWVGSATVPCKGCLCSVLPEKERALPVKRAVVLSLSTALLLAGCSDSKPDANKTADPDDKEAASGQVVAKFAAAWVKAWAPNGKPDEAALTDAPTTFGPRLDGIDS